MPRIISTTLLLVVFLLITTSCGDDQQSNLVGQWEIPPHARPFDLGYKFTLEFLKDGTYATQGVSMGKYSFPDGNRLKLDTGNLVLAL